MKGMSEKIQVNLWHGFHKTAGEMMDRIYKEDHIQLSSALLELRWRVLQEERE
jgi:hypothetical protein